MSKSKYIKCPHCSNSKKESKCVCINGMVPDPDNILCNNCGDKMCVNDEVIPTYGLVHAVVSAGCSSVYLNDTINYHFHICEKCIRNMFLGFKIKPTLTEYSDPRMQNDLIFNGYPQYTWGEDNDAIEYRLWKKDGHFHKAYLDSRCNVVHYCIQSAKYTYLKSGKFSDTCSCEEHAGYRLYYDDKLVPFINNRIKNFI